MLTVDDLLTLTERYCAAAGCTEVTLSKRLFNDGKRIRNMRLKNGDIGSRSFVKTLSWLSENWPESAERPAELPQSASTEAARVSA